MGYEPNDHELGICGPCDSCVEQARLEMEERGAMTEGKTLEQLKEEVKQLGKIQRMLEQAETAANGIAFLYLSQAFASIDNALRSRFVEIGKIACQ